MNLQKQSDASSVENQENQENSVQNSDFFKSTKGINTIDPFLSLENLYDVEVSEEKESISLNIEEGSTFYNALFSPSQVANSLIKHNQSLQINCLQNSYSLDCEEEENELENVKKNPELSIYKKRMRRMNKLKEKEKTQIGILEDVKVKDFQRYKAILYLFKIFYIAKKHITGIRNDYYSHKTFSAIKNSSAENLKKVSKVLLSMIQNIMKITKNQSYEQGEPVNFRIVQFMIIPRFLISKAKIKRFATDEQLQENIGTLIIHECLGHYNNESNKKFPEEKHMKLIEGLLKQKKGKQKYKRITSINHGAKFQRYHEKEYKNLFSKNLEYLTFLDQELKKGKKLQELKQSLQKFPDEQDKMPSHQFPFHDEKAKFDFKDDPHSLGDYLAQFEHEQRLSEIPLVKSSSCCIEEVGEVKKRKFQKRLNSLPTTSMEEIKEIKPKKFGMKKSLTMEIEQKSFVDENIILIAPSEEKQENEEQ